MRRVASTVDVVAPSIRLAVTVGARVGSGAECQRNTKLAVRISLLDIPSFPGTSPRSLDTHVFRPAVVLLRRVGAERRKDQQRGEQADSSTHGRTPDGGQNPAP